MIDREMAGIDREMAGIDREMAGFDREMVRLTGNWRLLAKRMHHTCSNNIFSVRKPENVKKPKNRRDSQISVEGVET